MDITKMLTLSTAHISEETEKMLNVEPVNNNLGLIVYKKAEYGYFVYYQTMDNKLPDEYYDLPEDLLNCILLAHSLDCKVICFDRDGEIISFLKEYDW